MTTTKIKQLLSLQEDLKNNIQSRSGVQTKLISRTHLIHSTPYSKHLSERAKAIILLYFHCCTATRTRVRAASARQLPLYHQ